MSEVKLKPGMLIKQRVEDMYDAYSFLVSQQDDQLVAVLISGGWDKISNTKPGAEDYAITKAWEVEDYGAAVFFHYYRNEEVFNSIMEGKVADPSNFLGSLTTEYSTALPRAKAYSSGFSEHVNTCTADKIKTDKIKTDTLVSLLSGHGFKRVECTKLKMSFNQCPAKAKCSVVISDKNVIIKIGSSLVRIEKIPFDSVYQVLVEILKSITDSLGIPPYNDNINPMLWDLECLVDRCKEDVEAYKAYHS